MKTIWLIFCLLILGCAHQGLVAPSGVGVSSAVGRTQTSVAQARKYNDVAVVQNANATTTVERIDAKAKVLEKYWK